MNKYRLLEEFLFYFPGTGKTFTGVKLAYHFVEMNKILAAGDDGGEQQQVLYCGPSNTAVDVAASK